MAEATAEAVVLVRASLGRLADYAVRASTEARALVDEYADGIGDEQTRRLFRLIAEARSDSITDDTA